MGFLLHQFDDGGLGSIAAADAGADDAGVAAVALGIFRSDLLEQLVGDGLSGNEAQRLTIGSQITLLAAQMGVGGDDSWGAPVHDEFLLSSADSYQLSFMIEPLN